MMKLRLLNRVGCTEPRYVSLATRWPLASLTAASFSPAARALHPLRSDRRGATSSRSSYEIPRKRRTYFDGSAKPGHGTDPGKPCSSVRGRLTPGGHNPPPCPSPPPGPPVNHSGINPGGATRVRWPGQHRATGHTARAGQPTRAVALPAGMTMETRVDSMRPMLSFMRPDRVGER
jgi:hypothetical protein